MYQTSFIWQTFINALVCSYYTVLALGQMKRWTFTDELVYANMPLCPWQNVSQQMAEIPRRSARQKCPPSDVGIHRHLLDRDEPARITVGGWQVGRPSKSYLSKMDVRTQAAELCRFMWPLEKSSAEADCGRIQFMEFRRVEFGLSDS